MSIKKIVISLAVFFLLGASAFAKETVYTDSNIAKILESNKKSDPIVACLTLQGFTVYENGLVTADSFRSSKFTVSCDLDLRYINERLEKNKGIAHVVKFVLESRNPKIYKISSISNLQSADEYIEEIQKNSNQRNGLGFITDDEVKNQIAENEKKGFGNITDYQVVNEKTRNAKLGFGFVTDTELENQRIENEKKGFGKIADQQVETQVASNKSAGLGELTDVQVEKQKLENEKKGFGKLTDEQIKNQIALNTAAGFGELTDVQVEKQKLENEKKGFGKLTDEQIKNQIASNKSAGFGELTDVQVEKQKLENEKKGFGKFTDEQIKNQIAANKAAGLGEITDFQATVQKKMNGFLGLGEISDLQVKNQIEKNHKSGKGDFTDFQIARREQLILDAKNYESKNQWIHALASYYDLMEENPTMDCLAAKESFEKIADAISNGKPGLGEYDEFEIYHSWKALCSEYENYWYEDCPLCFEFGDFKKGDLDYENRTATYSLSLTAQWTKKYLLIKQIVSDGYKKSYRTDWKGLSGVWPDTIRTTRYDEYYDGYGRQKRGCNYATIEENLYEVQFSLIGKDGKIFRENLKCNPRNTVFINGVNKDWIKLFDAKEMTVCVNSIFINNKSGGYFDVVKDWWVQESFSQEVQDKIIKIRLPYQNKIENKNAIGLTELVGFENQMKKINGGSYSYTVESGYGKNKKVETVTEHVDSFFMQSTEMTNEIFEALMEKDPEKYEKRKHPVVCSYVDAINFCNKLSEYYGRKPYYILGEKIDDRISSVTVDSSSNGFRLPTSTQWTFAASEGKMRNGFKYSGSNEIDEVAWYQENSRIRSGYDYKYETHEVGKKKPNAFGLYDMSGNEDEMVESSLDSVKTYGGSCSSSAYGCSVFEFHSNSYQSKGGFRVICPSW